MTNPETETIRVLYKDDNVRAIYTRTRQGPQVVVERKHKDAAGGEAWLIADSYSESHATSVAMLGMDLLITNLEREAKKEPAELDVLRAAAAYGRAVRSGSIEVAEVTQKDLCARAILYFGGVAVPPRVATPEPMAFDDRDLHEAPVRSFADIKRDALNWLERTMRGGKPRSDR